MSVVRDARGERAALETGPRDEAAADPAGREVTLDDGDLREVTVDRGDRDPSEIAGSSDDRLGDDLILDQPDRAGVPTVRHGIAKSAGESGAMRRAAAPSRGSRRARPSSMPAAALQHDVRLEAHEIGQHEQVCAVAGCDRAVG